MLSSCHGPAPAPWLLKSRSSSWLLSPAHCKPGAGDRALQPCVIPGWRPQGEPGQGSVWVKPVITGWLWQHFHPVAWSQPAGPPGQGASEGRGGHCAAQVPLWGVAAWSPQTQKFFCLLAPTVPACRAGGPQCKPMLWYPKMTKCPQHTGGDVAQLTKSLSGGCS